MSDKHPNIVFFEKLKLEDITGNPDIFKEDFVLHYFNPHLSIPNTFLQ